jgi:hypothetical protein
MTFVAFEKENYDFNQAGLYRKTATLDKANIVTAVGGEALTTIVNGQVETKNVAAEGDKIVTGSQGEQYIIKADKFPKLYEEDADNADRFVSKGVRKVLFLTEDTVIKASWGEEQFIKAGGAVVEDGDHAYGIEAKAFDETYGRANQDGKVVVAMSEPLETQRKIVQELGLDNHLNDIRARLKFAHASNNPTQTDSVLTTTPQIKPSV